MEAFRNPWVIAIVSGIVVAAILYLVRRIVIPKLKHRQKDITPKDIKKYLRNLPPLQQDSAADHYKGIRVSWKVNLRGGSSVLGGKTSLIMGYKGKHFIPMITCHLDLEQYPRLRVIKSTQLFTVEGEIGRVTLEEIELKNCRLSF